MEKHLNFGDQWDKVTVLDPIVAGIVIAMALFLLICPRKYSVWPFIVVACFVVPFQRIVIANLDFSMMRILTLVGLFRIMIRGEIKFTWKAMDTIVLVFGATRAILPLYNDASLISRNLGFAMDTLGIYLLFRCLIRNWDDVFNAVRGFCWIGIPVAGFFLAELISHKNAFAGQAAGYFSENVDQRGERFRCHGAFSHPILAGCFWATMMPMMAAMWWRGPFAKVEAFIGCFVSSIIVIACSSSTPVASCLFGCLAGGMYFVRYQLAWFRRGIILVLVAIQLCWDKPIWRLMAKADILSGSTGYYRYQLIDATMKHFSDWAWMGTLTRPDAWVPGLKDVTNNYIVYGFEGGVGLIVLFLLLLIVGFRTVGKIWRRAERDHDRPNTYAGWALGVVLFCHTMDFLSVDYFGQIVMIWGLHLAMIGSIASMKTKKRVRYVRVATAQQQIPNQPREVNSPNRPLIEPAPAYHGTAN